MAEGRGPAKAEGRGRGTAASPRAGRLGEETAVRHLEAAGYLIIERNYRCRLGEIDIIARDGDTLCFVEVKARRTSAFGGGLEAVRPSKQKRLRRVASYYLTRFGAPLPPCRFDAAEVWLGPGGGPETVRVIKDAF